MRGKLRCLAAMLAMVVLTGCSAKQSTSSTYSDYIQAGMECSYYGKTEEYMKACDATAAEAKEVHENTVEYYAYQLMDYNNIDYNSVSEEMLDKYIELAKTAMSKVKFTVNKATKVNGEYQVKVDIQPLDLNDKTFDAVEKCIDDYNAKFDTLDTTTLTDEQWMQLEEEYAQMVYDVLADGVANVGYKDVVSKIVIITVDDDGYYGISDDDWNDIDDIVVDMK